MRLINARLMKREQSSAAVHDYAPVQITQPLARKYDAHDYGRGVRRRSMAAPLAG